MPVSKQARAKDWGREVENAALKQLKMLFPGLKRVGSIGYIKDHPDLIQEPDDPTEDIKLVVTRDKRGPLLVTLSVVDLIYLAAGDFRYENVYVQCKGRTATWIGGLYAGLSKAVVARRA